MEQTCLELSRWLSLEYCEYLTSMKLLPDEPDSLIEDIIAHNPDTEDANLAMLSTWCNLRPAEASEDKLFTYLLEMKQLGMKVQNALLVLKPHSGI